MTKEDDHHIFDLQLPESVLHNARKIATYAGLSLEEFILSAISERLVEGKRIPFHTCAPAKKLRSVEIETTKSYTI